MRASLLARASTRVAERAAAAGLRRLEAAQHGTPGRIVVGGCELVNFGSNDYLGIASHPAVRAAAIACIAREGVGATAAHLLGGHAPEHEALERELAEWLERPAALLFSTGYHANLGVVGALLDRGELCVQDRLNHASLIDAAQLAGVELKRYPHLDVEAAARQLDGAPDSAAMLATDGVFSMDGTVAPLRELSALCLRANATLYVDDAHGLGVLGPDGRGTIAEAGLGVDDAPIHMATLGKAIGTFGAFVSGSRELIEALTQFARTFVFTTATPPALAAASRAAVRVARHERWRRDKLALLVRHFRSGASARNLALLDSRTPIQPIVIGRSEAALDVSKRVRDAGFFLPAIRPPTVAPGASRLRVTLTAAHSETDVDRLLDAIAEALTHVRPLAARDFPSADARNAARDPRTRRLRVRDRR